MTQFAELRLDEKVSTVKQRLNSAPVCVYGPTGSGRNELAKLLAAEFSVVVVEPPEQHEVDAPLHALAQSALDQRTVKLAFDDSVPLRERARRLSKALEQAGVTLLVRVPSSWAYAGSASSADAERRQKETFAVLQGWLEGSKRVVLFTGSLDPSDALSRLLPAGQMVNLPRVGIRRDALQDAQRWGAYLPHAEAVGRALDITAAELTPLQVRLAVGVVALGDDALKTVRDVQDRAFKSDLRHLMSRFSQLLSARHPAAWSGLQTIAVSRFPLPRADALELAGLAGADEPLVSQCVGYGDETIRIPEPVRRVIVDAGPAPERAHARLAQKYQQRDGALSPLGLSGVPLRTWLEKTHHLAQLVSSHFEGLQKWEHLEHPSKYLLWDRAKTLSRVHRRYDDAAKLYESSLQCFGDDDYAWHYYAFNRRLSGKLGGQTETAFRRAITPAWDDGRENPGVSNPWWNARLVTFLISTGKEGAAIEAWGRALDAIDPEQQRVRESPWLSLQFHQWIVKAWLDVANVRHARAAFALIPDEFVRVEPALQRLRWRLEDAEEAEELLESVYPASRPPPQRWVEPQVPEEGLTAWAPGRVVSASTKGVDVVMAEVRDGRPVKRVLRTHFSAKAWQKLSGNPPSLASGFFELQQLGRKERIVFVAAAQPHWAAGSAEELVYLGEHEA